MKILRGTSKRVKKRGQEGFLSIGGRISEGDEHRGGLPPGRLRLVMKYIETHLAEDLSLLIMANVLEMSPYHFGRLFKQSTGLTPHQYLVRQRIMKARELLADDRLSAGELGRKLGSASHTHFSTVFRKLIGTTPREYRLKIAK